MPKLWSHTIEAHRRDVRDAILETTATLAAKHGLLSVTMSQIAEDTGIGRATLYKYFGDVERILLAWHERQIAAHFERLAQVREQAEPHARLQAVLEEYALIAHAAHGHFDRELTAFLHSHAQLVRPQQQLRGMLRDLLIDGARRKEVRSDVSPDELATYCLHATAAASVLATTAAVRRLVRVTLSGVNPQPKRAAPTSRRRGGTSRLTHRLHHGQRGRA